jgi:hypothetical protein
LQIEVTDLRWLDEDDQIAYDFEMTSTHSDKPLGIRRQGITSS